MKKLAWAVLLTGVAVPSPEARQDKIAPNGVIWATSWDEALKEAQARNVPVHFTMHKDN